MTQQDSGSTDSPATAPAAAPKTPAQPPAPPAEPTARYDRAALLDRTGGNHLRLAERLSGALEDAVQPWDVAGALHAAGNPDDLSFDELVAHVRTFRAATPQG